MEFLQYKVHPLLRSGIKYYWTMEGDEIFSHKIIPDGYPELIFHYGDHFCTELANSKIKQPLAIAAGQLTEPLTILPSGKTGVIGVKFQPAGIRKMFGLNMRVITNAPEALDDVLNIGTHLQSSIREAGNNQNRIQLLDRFFLSRLDRHMYTHAETMINHMTNAGGQLTIKTRCNNNNISPRKLERISASRLVYLQKLI